VEVSRFMNLISRREAETGKRSGQIELRHGVQKMDKRCQLVVEAVSSVGNW
jgi:hypothetical protein